MVSRNIIKAYISHSIQGKWGVNATAEQMRSNNEKAKKFGRFLAEAFPSIEWYVPGEHDEFVMIAHKKGYITRKQILDVDCGIINGCNFMVVFSPDDYISRGMQVEVDHCQKTGKRIISAVDGNYHEYCQRIVEAINCYLITLMR